jgi:hypothetical protein
LPALRKKAQTPESKAILKRLGVLLDGKRGDTMTERFSSKDKTPDGPGVFSIGHAAGYGLLYQITGDKKYAQLGAQCFEKALAGAPDRDRRYGFRDPGGTGSMSSQIAYLSAIAAWRNASEFWRKIAQQQTKR